MWKDMIGRLCLTSSVELPYWWSINWFPADVTLVKRSDTLLTSTVAALERHVSLSLHTNWTQYLIL